VEESQRKSTKPVVRGPIEVHLPKALFYWVCSGQSQGVEERGKPRTEVACFQRVSSDKREVNRMDRGGPKKKGN